MPEEGAHMAQVLTLLYGLVAYVVFLGAFLYAIGFVGNLAVPKSIDSGATFPLVSSLIVNLLLMSAFALQHSVMARPAFKRWWTQIVPKQIERSTYVLLASLVSFVTRGLYKVIRHPIMLGFIIAFWATPLMTVGHVLFAAVTTTYILVAIQFEEHDLMAADRATYERYRADTRMLIPIPKGRR